MRAFAAALLLIALVPVLLIVAIAMGPIIVTLLFVAACALVVFLLWNIPIALAAFGHSIEKSARSHRAQHRSLTPNG